jgi:hypothetical protein
MAGIQTGVTARVERLPPAEDAPREALVHISIAVMRRERSAPPHRWIPPP